MKLLFVCIILTAALIFGGCTLFNNNKKMTEEDHVNIPQMVINDDSVAVPKNPKTMREFFHALPREYTEGKQLRTFEEKEVMLEIVDEENLYIKVIRPTKEVSTMKMFTMPGSETKFIVIERHRPEQYGQNIRVVQYENNEFTDVTDELFPYIGIDYPEEEIAISHLKSPFISENGKVETKFFYTLPREGTTIKIVEQFSKEEIAEVHWRKGVFSLEYNY